MVASRWAIPFSFLSCLARNSPVALCLLTLTVGACSRSTPPPPTPSTTPNAPEAGFLNGWRKGQDARELARTWYLTPQGSHLLDFDVFMSIPSASDQAAVFCPGEPRIVRIPLLEQLRGRHAGQRGNLPIGMVKDTRGEGHTPLAKHAQDLTRDYVGMTCAACHTGDLRYNGERFLIHAGQSNLDYERFISDLTIAVSKAVQDPKGTGYVDRMAAKGVDEKNATSRLAAAQQRMDGLRDRGQVPAGREAGPGRIDAVGHILNEVFGHQYGDPNNAATLRSERPRPASIKPIQVPVSVPAVWNAARLQCVQTNCLTSNSLTRNVGEVLGVFGDSETYQDPSGRWRVRSTAKVKNLYALEEALDWVESPKWSPKFPAPAGTPPRAPKPLPPTASAVTPNRISTSSARSGTPPARTGAARTPRAIWPITSSPRTTSARLDTCGGSPRSALNPWAPTTSSSRPTPGPDTP